MTVPFVPFQLKYKKDLNKMKGTSHFHSLTSEDNLTLKNARKINKLISEVSLCRLEVGDRSQGDKARVYEYEHQAFHNACLVFIFIRP